MLNEQGVVAGLIGEIDAALKHMTHEIIDMDDDSTRHLQAINYWIPTNQKDKALYGA